MGGGDERMRIRLFKNRSIFASWLISYFLLLLMPLTISTVVYLQAYRIVEAEITHVNTEVIKQVQIAFDSGLQDVRKFGAYVALNQNLNLLMKEVKRENLLERYYLVYHSINDLKAYNITNEYIDEYYVYLKQLDLVLTAYGIENSEDFYNLNQKGIIYRDIMTFNQWKDVLNKQYKGDYVSLRGKGDDTANSIKPIIYIKSLPIFGPGQPFATFVITLNNQRLYDAIQSIGTLNNAWGIILDSNDNILFSTRPVDQPVPVKYRAMGNMSGMLDGRMNDGDVKITYIASKVEDWKYISIMPARVFEEKVSYIRELIIWGIALSILLGGIVAFLFSRKNYSPMGDLVANLAKRVGLPSGKEYNEYRFIQDAMNNTLDENEKINERLKQQNSVLRSNFLMRLLKGRMEDNNYINETMDSYKLKFDSDYFIVMLFYITDFSKFYSNDKDWNSKSKFQLVQFIITNVVEELASQKNQAYMAEVDEMLACIVNFRNPDLQSGKQDMLHTATEAKNFIREKFNIDFIVSVSGMHKTVFGIPEAYQEALRAMEYKRTLDKEDIIFFDDMKSTRGKYNYPIETEHQLINCIKSGDFETSCSILNEVYDNNFSKSAPSNDMVRCLMFDLASTMLKTIPEINGQNDNLFLQELDIVERLVNCKKVQEMKQQMIVILSEICDYIQHNRKGRKEQLAENVMDYIRSNYHNVGLNVSVIADKFQLTPAYLTRLFKEQTGEGLFEYLTKVRMDKAKELLRSNEVSIKDLASKVGYFSSQAFIRAFKKCEGVTPGLYKEIE